MIGIKVLEEVRSEINGDIKVLKSLGFGTYVQAEGLTQSGGVVRGVWKTTLRKLKREEVKKCLILGLGGGSAATLVKKFWPEAEVTGVDIDPIMVKMGKKYLGLDKLGMKIFIEGAEKFVKRQVGRTNKYNLILIDTYCGYDYPKRFEEENYLRYISKLLSDNGTAIFNRLYFGDKRPLAVKFGKRLEKTFARVEVFYPEANVMFICRNLL